MKVSFILPAYKRRFLKEAIDSILAQTCRDFELVVVDDKSPENLYAVIGEYPWEPSFEVLSDGGKRWVVDGVPVRYYQNAENLGGRDLVAAWNHAMKYANGEWCVLASDDDVYLPGYLEEMVRLAAKYTQCDLVHPRVAVVDADGRWSAVGEQCIEFESQVQMVYGRGVKRRIGFAAEYMFRRSRLEGIGGFVGFPEAIFSDDATWMLLAEKGVACSRDVLFCWRDSGDNVSMRSDNVLAKHRAAALFVEWFCEFAKALSPATREESVLCDGIVRKVENKVYALLSHPTQEIASFVQWIGVLKASPFPRKVKLRMVLDRFPRLRALMRVVVP